MPPESISSHRKRGSLWRGNKNQDHQKFLNHKNKWVPWNTCLVAVIILSAYNIFLTVKIMYSSDCPKTIQLKQPEITQVIPIQQPLCNTKIKEVLEEARFLNLNLNLGRWDSKLLYKLFDQVLVGDNYIKLSQQYLVCLATQSSLERLASLVQVTENWNGPISAAVFASAEDELNLLITYILYLRRCFPNIRERVAFHIVVDKFKFSNKIQLENFILSNMNCMKPELTLEEILRKRSGTTVKWRMKNPYPQNHLRNVARKNCQSKYTFLTDVDIVPSINLAEELNKFLQSVTCKKLCAYVIPTYEIDNRVRFPPNKTELVRLANKGLARPFHKKVFIYNQYATNFSRWQNVSAENQELHISHPVTNFEFLYEPFYVAPDSAPEHDERFIGYGYTRNTQVYEMFVAGYQFLVLSPAFTCHWGLQVKRGRPSWREYQNNINRKHFETFKREVFAKYNKDPLQMMEKQKIQARGV